MAILNIYNTFSLCTRPAVIHLSNIHLTSRPTALRNTYGEISLQARVIFSFKSSTFMEGVLYTIFFNAPHRK